MACLIRLSKAEPLDPAEHLRASDGDFIGAGMQIITLRKAARQPQKPRPAKAANLDGAVKRDSGARTGAGKAIMVGKDHPDRFNKSSTIKPGPGRAAFAAYASALMAQNPLASEDQAYVWSQYQRLFTLNQANTQALRFQAMARRG